MTNQSNKPIYILFGSNINPEINLPIAAKYLDEQFKIQRFSSVWRSPPYGMEGPYFLNVVVEIISPLTGQRIKYNYLRKIESRLGRVRSGNKFSPRPIDLDIVAIGDEVVDEETWSLEHIAIPLSELAPDLINPYTGESLKSFADNFLKNTKMKKCFSIDLTQVK